MSTVKNFLGGASGQVCNIYITGLQSTDVVSAVTPMSSVVGAEYGNFLPNPAWRNLPSGYTQVEWIKSDGTQHINLGVKGTEFNGFTMKINIYYSEQVNTQNGILGDAWVLLGYLNQSGAYGEFWGVWGETDKTVQGDVTLSANASTLTINNDSYAMSYKNTSNDTYLFANNGNRSNLKVVMKFYEGTLLYQDTLLRNFVPCLNETTQKYGLYDLVGNTFYPDANGGNFSAGNTVPEYLPCFRIKAKDFGTYTITAQRTGKSDITESVLVDVVTDYEVKMTFGTIANYLKFIITKIRGSSSVFQMSEFTLYDGTNEYTWSDETISASLSGNSGETIDKLIDGSTSTKYCTSSWGGSQTGTCTIKIAFPDGVNISEYNKYRWYTANDSDSRDAISWTLSYSVDDSAYTEVSNISDASITTTRKALAGTWTMTGV